MVKKTPPPPIHREGEAPAEPHGSASIHRQTKPGDPHNLSALCASVVKKKPPPPSHREGEAPAEPQHRNTIRMQVNGFKNAPEQLPAGTTNVQSPPPTSAGSLISRPRERIARNSIPAPPTAPACSEHAGTLPCISRSVRSLPKPVRVSYSVCGTRQHLSQAR